MLVVGLQAAFWGDRLPEGGARRRLAMLRRRRSASGVVGALSTCGVWIVRPAWQPAAVSLAWARANSSWKGCAEAMASLMRRTDRRTWAPILSSARRSVPQVASANWVWRRPMRRSAQSRTQAIEANHRRSWLARQPLRPRALPERGADAASHPHRGSSVRHRSPRLRDAAGPRGQGARRRHGGFAPLPALPGHSHPGGTRHRGLRGWRLLPADRADRPASPGDRRP